MIHVDDKAAEDHGGSKRERSSQVQWPRRDHCCCCVSAGTHLIRLFGSPLVVNEHYPVVERLVRRRLYHRSGVRLHGAVSSALPQSIDDGIRLSGAIESRAGWHGDDQQIGRLVAEIAGVRVTTRHNTRLREMLSWESTISLEEGLEWTLFLDRGTGASATWGADRYSSGVG